MKIARIIVYQVHLPLIEGRYTWAQGKFVEVFDSTVVCVEADDGARGFGEVCPLGPCYLPAFGPGARAAIGEIAPHLLGLDPVQPGVLEQAMENALLGHPYAKSAIDMACWDLAGKCLDRPLCDLLGGRYGESVELYRALSQEAPQQMAERASAYRAEGYRKFQLKVGGGVEADIARIRAVAAVLAPGDVLVADANTGWTSHEALRVANAVRDLDVYIEQPCRTYEECLRVRQRTALPFILDENIDTVAALLRAEADRAVDVVNLKISRLGGLTRARRLRDLCVDLGLPMCIEDSWGSDIVTAAIAHLAHATPARWRFSTTDFNSYVTVRTARGAPRRVAGRLRAGEAPGLGIEPDAAVLGAPLAEWH